MQNVELSPTKLSVSVLLVCKEIPTTFVLRLVVERTRIAPIMRNVIAFNLPRKQENVKDFALEVRVLKAHHVLPEIIERYVHATLLFEETAIMNVENHRPENLSLSAE